MQWVDVSYISTPSPQRPAPFSASPGVGGGLLEQMFYQPSSRMTPPRLNRPRPSTTTPSPSDTIIAQQPPRIAQEMRHNSPSHAHLAGGNGTTPPNKARIAWHPLKSRKYHAIIALSNCTKIIFCCVRHFRAFLALASAPPKSTLTAIPPEPLPLSVSL